MSDIQPSKESWKITNNTTIPITINDIPELPVIKVGQTIEALKYTTANKLNNSPNFRNYLKNGTLISSGYLHTHDHEDLTKLQGGIQEQYYHLDNSQYIRITDFFKNTDITAEEAEVLTNGSNADNLHFHTERKIFLNNLEDVVITGPIIDGQVLRYDSSIEKWVNSIIPFISSSSSTSSSSSPISSSISISSSSSSVSSSNSSSSS